MLDALPPDLAQILAELQRRIKVLEGSNKLLQSAITNGTIKVYNSAGVRIAEMGSTPAGGGGIELLASNGTTDLLVVDQTLGFAIPWLSTGWKDAAANKVVTSGTFVSTYNTLTELLFASELRFRVSIISDVGTTGEARITYSGGSVLGNVKTIPSGANASYEYRIAHGFTLGGGPLQFDLEVRRTSGAGNITVYEPSQMHYGAAMVAVAGGWV